MELSRHERLRSTVKWLAAERGVNQRDIGELLGWASPVAFSQLLNGKKSIPEGLPARLAALDPRINIDFLTGISDEMIIGEGAAEVKRPEPAAPATPRVGIFVPPELAQMVTDLTSTIKEQQAMIRTLVNVWCKEKETKQ